MILIDFDRTLFDTDLYYAAIRNMVGSSVSQDDWEAMYSAYQQKHHRMHLFRMLAEANVMNYDFLNELKQQARTIAPEYVYPDSKNFLESLRRAGIAYSVLTFGDPEFQEFKIMAAGFGGHRFEVSTVNKAAHPLSQTADIIIDDNPNELMAFKHRAIKKFRMKRPGAKYSLQPTTDTLWHDVKSLEVVLDVL